MPFCPTYLPFSAPDPYPHLLSPPLLACNAWLRKSHNQSSWYQPSQALNAYHQPLGLSHDEVSLSFPTAVVLSLFLPLKKSPSLPLFTSFSIDDFISCFTERIEANRLNFLPSDPLLGPGGHLTCFTHCQPSHGSYPSLLPLEILHHLFHCVLFFYIHFVFGSVGF